MRVKCPQAAQERAGKEISRKWHQNTAAERKPRANSLEARRPEIIENLTFDLANPIKKTSHAELAEKFNISADDIRNFKRRNQDGIETLGDKMALGQWENIGDHFKALAFMAVERAKEALPKASAKDAAIIAGLSVEKSLLIENKGIHKTSVIHEHRHSVAGVLELLSREMKARGIKPEELPAKDVKALPPSVESTEGSPEEISS